MTQEFKHQIVSFEVLTNALYVSGETKSSESYVQDQQTLVTIPAIVTNTARLASLGIVSELSGKLVPSGKGMFFCSFILEPACICGIKYLAVFCTKCKQFSFNFWVEIWSSETLLINHIFCVCSWILIIYHAMTRG